MTLSMPATSGIFKTARWGLMTNTQRFVSPLSGQTQTLELTGARWAADYILQPMERDDAATWYAFLMDLGGSAGRFFGFDPINKTPRGTISGSTLLVDGASQTGTTLNCDGAALSTLVLKKGDYFEVNGELKVCTADCTSDGAGDITLTFKPSLRDSPADNAAVTIQDATCTMMLIDDQQAFYDIDEFQLLGLRFSAIEVI